VRSWHRWALRNLRTFISCLVLSIAAGSPSWAAELAGSARDRVTIVAERQLSPTPQSSARHEAHASFSIARQVRSPSRTERAHPSHEVHAAFSRDGRHLYFIESHHSLLKSARLGPRSYLKNRGEGAEARKDDAGILGYFEEDDRRIGDRSRFLGWLLVHRSFETMH
jgi:hypothetical protein